MNLKTEFNPTNYNHMTYFTWFSNFNAILKQKIILSIVLWTSIALPSGLQVEEQNN